MLDYEKRWGSWRDQAPESHGLGIPNMAGRSDRGARRENALAILRARCWVFSVAVAGMTSLHMFMVIRVLRKGDEDGKIESRFSHSTSPQSPRKRIAVELQEWQCVTAGHSRRLRPVKAGKGLPNGPVVRCKDGEKRPIEWCWRRPVRRFRSHLMLSTDDQGY